MTPKFLVLAGMLLCPGFAVSAGEDPDAGDEFGDFEELDMERLLGTVFSAARHGQDIADSPSAISVISREQIVRSACSDLPCLLSELPEVDVLRITPMYVAIGARALTDALGDKSLLLVDGVEVNSEFLGMPVWQALPVHLDDIERIEVIRGPGSALYGANAHSLVVSITSRRPQGRELEASLSAGEVDRLSLNARAGSVWAGWRLMASGGAETAGHWQIQDRREQEIGRFRLLAERDGEWGTTTLGASIVPAAGVYYSELAPLRQKRGLMGLAFARHRHAHLEGQVSFQLLQADLAFDMPLFLNGIKLGQAPDNMSLLNTGLDAALQADVSPFAGNRLLVGGNYRWNLFGSDAIDPERSHQQRVGLFVQDEQRLLDQLVLTAGVRLDYNTVTEVAVSPRAAVVWRPGLAQQHSIRLAYGRAFRKPSFINTSLHMKGFTGIEGLPEFFQRSVGNGDLGNESIGALEAGYRLRFLEGACALELDAFHNQYRDTIGILADIRMNSLGFPDLENSSFLFTNGGREIDSLGGAISVVWDRGPVRATANYTFRHSWYVSNPEDEIAAVAEGRKGDRVPWEPAHLLNAGVHWRPGGGFSLGTTLHLRSATNVARIEGGQIFGDYRNVHLPARLYANAYAAWRVEGSAGFVEAGVRVFDLFGARFRENSAVTRQDGVELGGELLRRQVLVFLRGVL